MKLKHKVKLRRKVNLKHKVNKVTALDEPTCISLESLENKFINDREGIIFRYAVSKMFNSNGANAKVPNIY